MKQRRGSVPAFRHREPLDSGALALYLHCMIQVFDMDDRARLPWRFFGAMCSITARL
jgi:hypothetical protein